MSHDKTVKAWILVEEQYLEGLKVPLKPAVDKQFEVFHCTAPNLKEAVEAKLEEFEVREGEKYFVFEIVPVTCFRIPKSQTCEISLNEAIKQELTL